ncbi:MAG: methylenetetrahydrofolate reductase, partial [Acidimicrobiia bacterium]|nr:methylenetetrahydrofolate reductase [Acidimicrobiia bacterium]
TDAASATVLREFPGVHLEAGVMEQVLNARDPVQAGIDAAVAQATAMLAIGEVVGVNLSGSATAGPVEESAAIMAAVGEALRSSRSAVRS